MTTTQPTAEATRAQALLDGQTQVLGAINDDRPLPEVLELSSLGPRSFDGPSSQ